MLFRSGYHEVGRADGAHGTRTTAAVSAFQDQEGLPVTGRFDPATLARLRDPRTRAR